MSESAKDHRAPAVHPSALAIVDEQEALVVSANHEASQQLVPAGTADRFARVLAAGRPSAGEAGCLLESGRSASAQWDELSSSLTVFPATVQ